MAEATDGGGKKPCQLFLRGRCGYGSECRYSHKFDDDEAAQKHAQRQTLLKEREDKLRLWRFNIPLDKRQLRRVVPLGSKRASFITTALELVETDADRMQEVITSLASEGGLTRIGELVDCEDLDQASQQALSGRFEHRILPLLRLMSNEEVLISAIVESQHATICNYLFGVNGSRSVALFAIVLRCIPARMSALSASVITLSYIYSVNSLAQLNQDLRQHAEKLCDLANGAKLEGSAARHLLSLRTRLGLISKIDDVPDKPKKVKLAPADLARFTVERDLPGELSRQGARHDNDKQDFDEIAVMPTIQEIESDRNEYLPTDDPQDWHVAGMLGLLDRQFRLLREDTVGQLRDAAKAELDRLKQSVPDKSMANRGARTRRYDNVRLVDMVFHPYKGLILVLSFDQPQVLSNASNKKRKEYWEDSNRLNAETLICLLGSNGYTAFLTISTPPDTRGNLKPEGFMLKQDARWSDPQVVTVLAHLVDESAEEIEALLQNFGHGFNYSVKHCLIEFPGILLPAFKPTLMALQEMSFKEEYPFADVLGPLTEEQDERRHIPPPLYAQHQDFRFDLSCLVTDDEPLTLDPAHPIQASELCERSNLDLGQAEAIIAALTHSFALIQGPPGTGKSYTGEALMKVLLANKQNGDLNSILFTSYTNHALDQALEHHVDAGVEQIVRIGSRSKSEKLAAINLHTVAMQYDDTKKERALKWKIRHTMDDTSKQIHTILAELRCCTSEAGINAHLRKTAEHFWSQLFDNHIELDEHGQEWQVVGGRRTFDEYLNGGSRVGDCRPLHELRGVIDLEELTHSERSRLYQAWIYEIVEPVQRKLIDKLAIYSEEKQAHEKIDEELKLRVLSASNVIGVTTSGLARNLSYLRRLNSKVLVVEEAGEVLEAHILTALLPSIEHVVLIGDHQQLRPKAQNYDLSCENPRSQVTLDVSLFERLVDPKPGFSKLPYSTLNTQRRMHPEISAIIRNASYSELVDGPSVQLHPPVTGMKHRLFWFDHQVLEDSQNDDLQSTSHTNDFEVEMVSSLVQHIVNQGIYSTDDIAVITPYLGQLRKLRRKLQHFSHIVLNERDNADLELDQDDSEKILEESRPTYSRSSLLRAVRLATVDNFQGEEAKVVIISLVRSNKLNKCGFLRTPNRMNVLLSRAKHGMYIIGNTATAANLVLMSSYGEVDLNESPCIFLRCGHIFTVESLDGVMNMAAYYDLDITGMPMSINGPSIPFSYRELKHCPDCRASLADVERYGRIIKRATLDESTKKFISWSKRECNRFAIELQKEQDNLVATRESFKVPVESLLALDRSKLDMPSLVKALGDDRRYRRISLLRGRLSRFSKEVHSDEQPFKRVQQLVELARRRAAPQPGPNEFQFDNSILQTSGGILVETLRVRLDCVVYNDLAYLWKTIAAEQRSSFQFNFSSQREVCDDLRMLTKQHKYPLQQTESNIFWAQFAAMQLMLSNQANMYSEEAAELRQEANQRLDEAQALCEQHSGQTQSVHEEVEEIRKMLTILSPTEMRMVVQAMAKEFSTTGHWYRCINDHPFTIGECGLPMQRATCPECGAGIGGEHHQAVAGMQHAEDIEQQFGGLQL
ncbi:hypothetical protein AMS68_007079 [Peltaster fructicola]|uniref:Uncharacterized protein n=1 Tax=Peltaster fructicola TaxID=286661 RepID=A0A6H0Y3G7_9PEZI|nr:hypothetical protein AMS68_007079 [Peltaster fructicola]